MFLLPVETGIDKKCNFKKKQMIYGAETFQRGLSSPNYKPCQQPSVPSQRPVLSIFFFSSLSSHKVHLNYCPRSASDTGFVCSCRHCERYTSALQFCTAGCQVKEMCCCDHSRPRTQQVNLAAAFSWQHSCVHTRYLLAELQRVGVILIFFFFSI